MTGTRAALTDPEARALIATALDTTLVVEAAAGTGKTTALVGRILRVIASGEPDAIRNNEEVKRAYLGEQHVVVGHG